MELFDTRTGGFTPPTPGIGMNVEVKDPDMKIILSRVRVSNDPFVACRNVFLNIFILQVYSYEGKISFTSHIPGEHIICLYSNTTAWVGGTQLVIILYFCVKFYSNWLYFVVLK